MRTFFKDIKIKMLFISIFAFFFASCSESGKISVASESGYAAVRVVTLQKSVPLSDSLVLDMYGPDTIHKNYTDNFNNATISLTPGEWKFVAKFYANGILLQKGEKSKLLKAGDDVDLSISMYAVAGFLYVKIPLGGENSLGISSGTLELSGNGISNSYPFTIDKLYATAATGILMLDSSYESKIQLFNLDGDTLYSYSSSVTLGSQNFSPIWELSSLRANARLSVINDTATTFSAVGLLPSKLRKPKEGDLFVTEFSIQLKPKFVEYFNSSLDTLDLENCSMAFLSASSSSPKNIVDSMKSIKLPPQSFFVIGSDSADFANLKGLLSMPSTKGSFIFYCGENIIDSLYYHTKTDSLDNRSLFPISEKQTTQLQLSNFEKRSDGDFWCLGEPSPFEETKCE